MTSFGEKLAEYGYLPDTITRAGIRYRCSQILAEHNKGDVMKEHEAKLTYIDKLRQQPIAIHTKEANQQHYEVPTEFFQLVMGKHMKYSCCFYTKDTKSLDEAEANMLNIYCERAQLADGMDVLDLGCGWGSFSLFAAPKYPNSRFTAVSNSNTQREFIQAEAKKRGINNLEVRTADVNVLELEKKFDRIVTIEMFEHMKNYEFLFNKVSSWLKPEGMLFIHIFCHKTYAYDFVPGHWMADNFFSGGTMPSADLLLYFQKNLSIVNHWLVNGDHYQKTSEDWLKNMDKNILRVREIFAKTYGKENAPKWVNMWRLFFLAVAELFGYAKGQEWIVTHYLFKKN